MKSKIFLQKINKIYLFLYINIVVIFYKLKNKMINYLQNNFLIDDSGTFVKLYYELNQSMVADMILSTHLFEKK